MRHGEPAGSVLPGVPSDGGRVGSSCVYLRGLEHVGSVEDDAEGDGRSDERGHIPIPPCLWLPGRLQPFLCRRVSRVVGARPADHDGERPGVRPPPLERDGGVPLRGGLCSARGGAPPAPLARPLLAHYSCLPCSHGAAPDDPLWEEGVL